MKIQALLAAAALVLPQALPAQDQQQPQQQQQPGQQQPAQQQPQVQAGGQQAAAPVPGDACPVAQQQGQQKKPSFAKDAGNAAAHTGGQLAGAAVAGPIGAAVGGVAVDHVGHAVKKVVKGKKKNAQPDQAQQVQACTPQQAQPAQ